MAADTVCPKCGGTGFIIVEGAHVSGAKRCDCRFHGRAERLLERAQIPPLYGEASFDNFNAVYDKSIAPGLKQILNNVRTYAEQFHTNTLPGLLLIGGHGTGKTHLAVAAMRRIIELWNDECLFWGYQNLLDSIRSGYDPASNSTDKEAYRAALEVDVLLLDDLGAHRVTDWVEDTITSIITYRCNNKKALIATTNLPDADAGSVIIQRTPMGVDYRKTLADHIGLRARSRLFEMCKVLKMPIDADYRIRRQRIP